MDAVTLRGPGLTPLNMILVTPTLLVFHCVSQLPHVLCSPLRSTWKFVVFVHAKIGELKVKDLSQKLQGISGFIFHLQLCGGQQPKHQILLKAHTE